MIGTEPALTRAHEEYLAAINANDLEAVLAMLTDDAIYLPPNEPAVAGKEAIRPWIEGSSNAFRTHWEKETLELFATGDWAIEYAAERVKDIPVDGGEPLEDICKGIIIYRRQRMAPRSHGICGTATGPRPRRRRRHMLFFVAPYGTSVSKLSIGEHPQPLSL